MDKKIIDNKPLILEEGAYDSNDVDRLVAKYKPQIYDIYKSQLEELFEVSFPSKRSNDEAQKEFINERCSFDVNQRGSWAYLPWSNSLYHLLNKDDFYAVLTNRNKLLITEEEQRKLIDSVVIVLGMSVGNAIVTALAHSGIARTLVIADFDRFSTANMNRVRVNLEDVGKPKVIVTRNELYNINPYLDVEVYEEAIKPATLESILVKYKNKKTVVFDEIDDFKMKVHTRVVSKKAKVPVIMLTGLGDNLLIDIERYDTQPETEVFNGLLGDTAKEIIESDISETDEKRFAAQTVGIANVPTRALQSLLAIGQTLVGRPQLYGTVTLDGGFGSYIVRNIALGNEMPSGRYNFSYAKALGLAPLDIKMNKQRNQVIESLKKLT